MTLVFKREKNRAKLSWGPQKSLLLKINLFFMDKKVYDTLFAMS